MNIKPIKSKRDYQVALKRVEELLGAKENTPDRDEFEVLFILIEAYEEKHFPIPPPHPLESIKFKIEQGQLDDKELTKILGGRSRKSKILSGKRKLSLTMIRALHQIKNSCRNSNS